jgi:hypothetical protein
MSILFVHTALIGCMTSVAISVAAGVSFVTISHYVFTILSVIDTASLISSSFSHCAPLTSAKAKIPPPLQIPPSRARRQFALRLAQRKAELEGKTNDDGDDDEDEKTQEQEEREGHQRFAKMFEDIESDSDDGSLGSIEDDIVGRLDVEGRSSPGKERKPEGGASSKKSEGGNVAG